MTTLHPLPSILHPVLTSHLPQKPLIYGYPVMHVNIAVTFGSYECYRIFL